MDLTGKIVGVIYADNPNEAQYGLNAQFDSSDTLGSLGSPVTGSKVIAYCYRDHSEGIYL